MIELIIEVLTLALALGGLLLQTRHDPGAPPSWRNLSKGGRLILMLLVVATSFKIFKTQQDNNAQEIAAEKRAEEMDGLKVSNANLLSTNQHLIKVMSVASGYSALLSGVVIFEGVPNGHGVEEALRNLFLKYAEIEITASNRLGTYQGRVDYGAHPEVRRYLNLQHIQSDPVLLRLQSRIPEQKRPSAFFFEIRCANLKILNQDKIQYARFDEDEPLRVSARVFDWWRDFRSLYGVHTLYIDKLMIEELGEVNIKETF
ncbi:hypothetical protein BK661_10160 [Pseudomonas frederiksbergensis]|uniref:Uncharacterized protein n=1 Tax=Pseudomonas frederiksbergensis TaxID=104087 RepID=A0A423J9S5_9PSED|nr:hypothetical protein [Pseudomonas frederiksbergensis]RON34433.1 hypothetical protein BK661_10160 [Pseudomonas frederiksbergensis]